MKMKIKGWEKKGDTYNRIIYLNTDGSRIRNQVDVYKDYDNLWTINYGRPVMEKTLKTKAQALAFAIQYMKSHPNG